jgi:hypothetical protein
MNCERIQDILSAYLENELCADDRAFIQDHLKTCPECSALSQILRETQEALHGFPELEVRPELLSRLYVIPDEVKKPKFSLADFLQPAVQPVLSAATAFLLLFSFYTFNPEKKSIDRFFNRQLHQGYNTVEKLYAKAGSLADELGSFKDTVLGSLKDLKILGGQKDKKK